MKYKGHQIETATKLGRAVAEALDTDAWWDAQCFPETPKLTAGQYRAIVFDVYLTCGRNGLDRDDMAECVAWYLALDPTRRCPAARC